MNIKKAFIFLILILFLPVCCFAEGAVGFLYRVTLGERSLWLLGSVHVGYEEMYPFSDTILNALSSSDLIVTECDTSSTAAQSETVSRMMYIGDSLQNHISGEAYSLLFQVCEQEDFPILYFNQLKPWEVTSVLSSLNASDISVPGIEETVLQLADSLPVEYLESVTSQLDMLDSFSETLQEVLLTDACNALLDTSSPLPAEDYGIWWRNGDEESFIQSFQEEFNAFEDCTLSREYKEKLLTNRNCLMLEKLLSYLSPQDSRKVFVVVGLAHLIFPDENLLLDLQREGCTVERIR